MTCPMCRGVITEAPVYVFVEERKEAHEVPHEVPQEEEVAVEVAYEAANEEDDYEDDYMEQWQSEQAYLLMRAQENNPNLGHFIQNHSFLLSSNYN